MKFRVAVFFLWVFFVATSALADSGFERWKLIGYYGLAFVSPSDVNNLASSQSTTPKLGSISQDTLEGAGLGHMLSNRWEVRLSYEMQDAKNPTKVSSPFSSSNAGYEMAENLVWADINYYLSSGAHTFSYIGAGAGYPIYSHLTATLTTTTAYDAAKTLNYRGKLGVGVNLGKNFSLFAEGGYQSVVAGNLQSPSGATLKNTTGGNASVVLSGVTVLGGLTINF